MDIYGIDFTSSPNNGKPITCQHCRLDGRELRAVRPTALTGFSQFEEMLAKPGPWIAGIDFPFGLPRRFVVDVDWPLAWQEYVLHAKSLGKDRFETVIKEYGQSRPDRQKQPRRMTDDLAGALSPLKLDFVPVGKMFFQGAPRLVAAGVEVPRLQHGDSERTVVEAYPGVLARSITKDPYKSDKRKEQTAERHVARCLILKALTSGSMRKRYGVTVVADDRQRHEIVEDPTGDRLDALLCAVQVAWAWLNREWLFRSSQIDSIEGWIADPEAVESRQVQMPSQRPRPDTIDSSGSNPSGNEQEIEAPKALQDEFKMLREQAIRLRHTKPNK